MQSVLVTGGAGFIGSCLVRQLLAEGVWRVINYDKLTYAGNLESIRAALKNRRHVFVRGDVAERDRMSAVLVTYRPQAIIHLAAESHVDRSIDDPVSFIESNVVGTLRLLEATRLYWHSLSTKERHVFRFLHVSTDEVYGTAGVQEQFSESSRFSPNSPYAASKAATDHFVRAYFRTYRLPVLTTNCGNNYGPFQFPEKLIPAMILKAVAGQALPVYGDGGNIRDWLYVEDHCSALRLVLERGVPGQVYNVGANHRLTNLQVVKSICNLVDRFATHLVHRPTSGLITFVEDRPGHDERYAIDTKKIREELGWRPSVSWESGLERTVRWYLSNSEWVNNVSSEDCRHVRLGVLQERVTAN